MENMNEASHPNGLTASPAEAEPEIRSVIQQVARLVEQRIEDGAYPPATYLPIDALEAEFNVSSSQLDIVVELLRRRGLVNAREKFRTMVRPEPGYVVVDLMEGDTLEARPATPHERRTLSLEPAMWLMQLRRTTGEIELYAPKLIARTVIKTRLGSPERRRGGQAATSVLGSRLHVASGRADGLPGSGGTVR